MGKWKACKGAGTIIHSFLATGPNQISVIPGDHMRIIETNDNWYRGENLNTKRQGIFPACCCSFKATDNLNEETFFESEEDCLVYEAKVTIHFALEALDHIGTPQGLPPERGVQIVDRMSDVVSQLKVLETSKAQFQSSAHATLASNIDHLRAAIGVAPIMRGVHNYIATVSTFDLNSFLGQAQGGATITTGQAKQSEYVLFHIEIKPGQVSKNLLMRVFLEHKTKKPFLSCPYSKIITPSCDRVNLAFTQLEMKDMRDPIYLVIYTYELTKGDPNLQEDRDFFACAAIQLPEHSSLTDFGKTTLLEIQSQTSKDSLPNLHKILIQDPPHPDDVQAQKLYLSQQKALKRFGPTFHVSFTAYAGSTENVLQSQNLLKSKQVLPLLLPSQISTKHDRSTIAVSIPHVTLNSKARSKLTLYVINHTKHQALGCIEDVQDSSLLKNQYSTVLFKAKEIDLAETFIIDLAKFNDPLSDLDLIVQLEHGSSKLVPAGYAVIPLASELGPFTEKISDTTVIMPYATNKSGPIVPTIPLSGDATVPNVEFSKDPKGKPLGSFSYQLGLASTHITSNASIYQLMHWEQHKSELKNALNAFKFSGLREWSKFVTALLSSLVKIISSEDDLKVAAFDALQSIFSDMFSKGGADCVQLFDEFIASSKIPPSFPEKIFPLISTALSSEMNSQEFRSAMKCLPYFLKLVAGSVLEPSPSSNGHSANNQKVFKPFFNQLNKIVAIEDQMALTSQMLIIKGFTYVIDAVELCLNPMDSASAAIDFIKAIHSHPKLNEAKMKCLITLVSKQCWLNPESREKMKPIFTEEIKKGTEDESCQPFIFPLIASLFFSVRDTFIIQFLPLLANPSNPNKAQIEQESLLILIIAYQFPTLVPLDQILKVTSIEMAQPETRFFVITNSVCRYYVEKKNEMKNIPAAINAVFQTWSSCACEYSLDYTLMSCFYDINHDFSVIKSMFLGLPKKNMIESIDFSFLLISYMKFVSPPLKEIYIEGIKADCSVNNQPKKLEKDSFQAIYTLAEKYGNDPKFANLAKLYTAGTKVGSPKIEALFERFTRIIETLKQIIALESNPINEDEKTAAYISLIDESKAVQTPEIEFHYVVSLALYHRSLGNSLETAYTLLELLPLIKPDYEEIDIKKFPDYPSLGYKAKIGRDFHKECLFECVDLVMKSGYNEYALPLLDRIEKDCILNSRNIELYPQVMRLQSKIYENIAKKSYEDTSKSSKKYSNFFIVTYGDNLSPLVNKRTFLYRRDSSYDIDSFAKDLHTFYPKANVQKNALSPSIIDPSSSSVSSLIKRSSTNASHSNSSKSSESMLVGKPSPSSSILSRAAAYDNGLVNNSSNSGNTKPDAKGDSKSESKGDSKSESKTDSKAESKGDSKSESKSDLKAESKTDKPNHSPTEHGVLKGRTGTQHGFKKRPQSIDLFGSGGHSGKTSSTSNHSSRKSIGEPALSDDEKEKGKEKDKDGRDIFIVSVDPVLEEQTKNELFFPNYKVPSFIYDFAQNDKPTFFKYQSEEDRKPVEIVFFQIKKEDAIPTMKRRSVILIDNIKKITQKPLTSAIYSVAKQTHNLMASMWKVTSCKTPSKMALNYVSALGTSIMTSASSKETLEFAETFLGEEYRKSHSAEKSGLDKLKTSIEEQIKAIIEYGQFIEKNLPAQKDAFQANFEELKKKLSPYVETEFKIADPNDKTK